VPKPTWKAPKRSPRWGCRRGGSSEGERVFIFTRGPPGKVREVEARETLQPKRAGLLGNLSGPGACVGRRTRGEDSSRLNLHIQVPTPHPRVGEREAFSELVCRSRANANRPRRSDEFWQSAGFLAAPVPCSRRIVELSGDFPLPRPGMHCPFLPHWRIRGRCWPRRPSTTLLPIRRPPR
jgi:hypothetical protein